MPFFSLFSFWVLFSFVVFGGVCFSFSFYVFLVSSTMCFSLLSINYLLLWPDFRMCGEFSSFFTFSFFFF